MNPPAATLTNSVSIAAAALVGNAHKQTAQEAHTEELKVLSKVYTDLTADCVRSVVCVSLYAILGE